MMSCTYTPKVLSELSKLIQTDVEPIIVHTINRVLDYKFDSNISIKQEILQHLGFVKKTNIYILDMSQSMYVNEKNIKTITQQIENIYKLINVTFIIIIVRDYDKEPITVYKIDSLFSCLIMSIRLSKSFFFSFFVYFSNFISLIF